MLNCQCDLCGLQMERDESRYEMRVEVRLANQDRALAAEDFSAENIGAVTRLLRGLPLGEPAPVEPAGHHAVFDLCPSCCRRWRRNPLGARPAVDPRRG
jgi:hypothetical protein